MCLCAVSPKSVGLVWWLGTWCKISDNTEKYEVQVIINSLFVCLLN